MATAEVIMPLYDYQCDACGHLFEVNRKRTEPHPEACPSCAAANPRRAISATSFRLKGDGWYVTDYNGTNPSTQARHGGAPAEGGEEGSSDPGGSDASSAQPSAPSTDTTTPQQPAASAPTTTSGEVA